jgi:hypothetical protein
MNTAESGTEIINLTNVSFCSNYIPSHALYTPYYSGLTQPLSLATHIITRGATMDGSHLMTAYQMLSLFSIELNARKIAVGELQRNDEGAGL